MRVCEAPLAARHEALGKVWIYQTGLARDH